MQEAPTFVQEPNLCLIVVEGLCSPFPDRFGDADAVVLVRNDLTPAVLCVITLPQDMQQSEMTRKEFWSSAQATRSVASFPKRNFD